jgi:Protein of unknown function (DUF2934)
VEFVAYERLVPIRLMKATPMVDDLEERIRQRAHKMWVDEGRPDGKEESHWSLAKMAIAFEDARGEMLRPVEEPRPEPIEAWVNQAEMPTLTDQGEQSAPGQLADPNK